MAATAAEPQPRVGVVLGVSAENSMGFHIARALVADGARAAITCRPSRGAAIEPLARAAGFDAVLPLEAGDEPSFRLAFGSLERRWGRLDFLVHCMVHAPAGALERPLLELRRDELFAIFDAACASFLDACRHAAPLLRRSPAPRVVVLTSDAGARVMPRQHAIGIAKGALESAARYVADELGPDGVLVNAASFSLIATDGAVRAVGADAAAATRARQARRAPTRRAVDIDDVTEAVRFLAGPRCRGVTGRTLVIDGGYSTVYFG
jgi:enoyl-[acyl-carrier protein] reductase I